MLWKPKSTHGPLQKHATPISQHVWLKVGIEDPPGVVEIQAHSWGTVEKYQHIYSLINICTCTPSLFVMMFVTLLLQAEISPVKFTKDMNKTPSQHAAPCNGNGGYPLPTQARIATGDKYPGGGDGKIRNAIAFEQPTHSRSDGAKAPIAFHIRILVRRGRPLPLALSPRLMELQFCTPRKTFSHVI